MNLNMKMKEHTTAIVLAGGRGRRMESNVQKQYMLLDGKPLIYYSLKEFQESPEIDEIILVSGKGDIDYCREKIVKFYSFDKVEKVVEGGKERYDSVYAGLRACKNCSYVLVHDGARPFLNSEMIKRAVQSAKSDGACVLGMPVKDTIRISDENGYTAQTPPRDTIWTIQTPQAFSYSILKEAYENMFLSQMTEAVTDDGMVVEKMLGIPVRLIEGSYRNIKITTPEDMVIAETFLKNQGL